MKILKRFLTVVNTVLFLTLSTNLPTFAQEKYFGINPIPNDYLVMEIIIFVIMIIKCAIAPFVRRKDV